MGILFSMLKNMHTRGVMNLYNINPSKKRIQQAETVVEMKEKWKG